METGRRLGTCAGWAWWLGVRPEPVAAGARDLAPRIRGLSCDAWRRLPGDLAGVAADAGGFEFHGA